MYQKQRLCLSDLATCEKRWRLDESFVCAAVIIHIISLCSSSMVEEEQYTWHFLTSTLLFVFLRTVLQSLPAGPILTSSDVTDEKEKSTCHRSSVIRFSIYRTLRWENYDTHIQIFCIFMVLICQRILRGWHQGGVNWTYLPDISKLLEDAGTPSVEVCQIASVLFVMCSASFALYIVKSMRTVVLVLQFNICIIGLLVILYILTYCDHEIVALSGFSATSIAQLMFVVLGVTVLGTALVLPWTMPIPHRKTCKGSELDLNLQDVDRETESLIMGMRDSAYLIGWIFVVCWCFLQLLLQQAINAVPILLLLLQILASMVCFSLGRNHCKYWVEVAALYFLGMAGHFSLGNSNGLATVHVAGAFIGITRHSTSLSGILLFMITYASPLLFLLSMMIYSPMKMMKGLLSLEIAEFGYSLQMMISVPCLLPMGLNSVVLLVFTIILLLMRDHLFIWSVFSPKYLYVCAATVSVYIGVFIMAATVAYTIFVFSWRKAFTSKAVVSAKLSTAAGASK